MPTVKKSYLFFAYHIARQELAMLMTLKKLFSSDHNLSRHAGPERALSRKLARELSREEVLKIAGGDCCPTSAPGSDNCDCYC
jgi:hypothetical protein